NSRSNPATYIGFYDTIRDLFARAPAAAERGYKVGRFSFNVKGGRCEECQGEGVITTQLYFMPDVEVTCGACKGARFNAETLEVTLRGGEAQRIKIATELSKLQRAKHTLYILDEPTTGLHLADVERLLESLNRLVDAGHTVLVIEHHLGVIKTADWVIDLGPEGGHAGGEVVVTGTPEAIAACKQSHTGRFLKARLRR